MDPTPKLYEHVARPQWGRGVVIEDIPERTRYLFEDGSERAFRRGDPSMREAQLPDAERDALLQKLVRRRAPKKTGTGSSTRRARPEESLTFAAQEAIFRAIFPLGFADPKYVLEERGTATGKDRYKDAAMTLAQELLAPAALDALIADGKDSEVFERAVKVERVTKNLLFPKTEKPDFESMPPDTHPRFARALRDLLYGTGDHAARFDALVSGLAMKTASWPAATLFPAIVHPHEHVFVKATFSQRQARVLKMDEPPAGIPSGAGYAQHLSVARALRDQLLAAGHQPRDLFDVYSFSWKTLRDETAKPKKAPPSEPIDD